MMENREKTKYLIVKGVAGLGNRLFSVCDAIQYALRTKRVILIDWSEGLFGPKGKNIFYEYFQLKNIPHILSLNDIPNQKSLSYFPSSWRDDLTNSIYDKYEFYTPTTSPVNKFEYVLRKLSKIRNKESFSKYYGYWKVKDSVKKETEDNFLPVGHLLDTHHPEDVVVYCDYNPPFIENNLLNHLALKEDILNKINKLKENIFKGNTIGIHIRNTDKKPEREIKYLVNMLRSPKYKKYYFFIATDSYDVFERVNKYDNVVYYPKKIPIPSYGGIHHGRYTSEYDYPEQMLEESIIDLWLLSQCDYLWYQGNSTYSIIARSLHGHPSKQWDWNSDPIKELSI